MTAEITLDGTVLKTGLSYPLGTEIQAKMGFISPNKDWGLANKQFQAGEYHAIGYDMQGLSKAQIEKIKAKLEQAKAKIESKEQAQIATLTSHDVTGAILQAVVQGYYVINDTQDKITATRAKVTKLPYMSFGTFSTNIQGVYSWGVLRQGKLTGMMMDIDRLAATSVDKDNKAENLINFNAVQGSRMSANEHLVPEQFFNDPNATTKNVDGISAVKALQIAASQGQKIYRIDQSNISTVLPLLNLKADTIQDIQNAVAAGKVVTTSQTTITQNGWTGSGYIILDPNTGAGAYMIGGGADGGKITAPAWQGLLAVGLLALVGSGLIAAFAPVVWIYLAILLFLVSTLLLSCAASNYYQNSKWADSVVNLTGAVLGMLFSAAGGGIFLGGILGFAYAEGFTVSEFSSYCVAA